MINNPMDLITVTDSENSFDEDYSFVSMVMNDEQGSLTVTLETWSAYPDSDSTLTLEGGHVSYDYSASEELESHFIRLADLPLYIQTLSSEGHANIGGAVGNIVVQS